MDIFKKLNRIFIIYNQDYNYYLKEFLKYKSMIEYYKTYNLIFFN